MHRVHPTYWPNQGSRACVLKSTFVPGIACCPCPSRLPPGPRPTSIAFCAGRATSLPGTGLAGSFRLGHPQNHDDAVGNSAWAAPRIWAPIHRPWRLRRRLLPACLCRGRYRKVSRLRLGCRALESSSSIRAGGRLRVLLPFSIPRPSRPGNEGWTVAPTEGAAHYK